MKWAFVLAAGLLIGWNIGGHGNSLDNLWDKQRDGLIKLNSQMAEDKTARLGACFVTEKKSYSVQSIDGARIVCGFVK